MGERDPGRPRPALYTIPVHRAFADALAAGLIKRFGSDALGAKGCGDIMQLAAPAEASRWSVGDERSDVRRLRLRQKQRGAGAFHVMGPARCRAVRFDFSALRNMAFDRLELPHAVGAETLAQCIEKMGMGLRFDLLVAGCGEIALLAT